MRQCGFFINSMLILAFCMNASGSEEEFMSWNQVNIVTQEYKETGKVRFEARTDGERYKAITIVAFRKRFSIDKKELSRFSGFPLSSLSITHEAGYRELGGHTVHVRMKRVYYKSQSPVHEKILISISRDKGLEIHGPEPEMSK